MKHTNYIAFSLWGNNPIYSVGTIKNIKLANQLYPEWKLIVYYDDSVSETVIDEIISLGAVAKNMTGVPYGPFWRFFAADIPDCQYAIFRDSDSRLTLREKLAVDEWIRSGKSIHMMRDHPHHFIPHGSNVTSILAGMWGIKGGILCMQRAIQDFCKDKSFYYGIDQSFLEAIYLKYQDDIFVHDEFNKGNFYPLKRINYRFIGEKIDENDHPVNDDWRIIQKYYRDRNLIIRIFKRVERLIYPFKMGKP